MAFAERRRLLGERVPPLRSGREDGGAGRRLRRLHRLKTHSAALRAGLSHRERRTAGEPRSHEGTKGASGRTRRPWRSKCRAANWSCPTGKGNGRVTDRASVLPGKTTAGGARRRRADRWRDGRSWPVSRARGGGRGGRRRPAGCHPPLSARSGDAARSLPPLA